MSDVCDYRNLLNHEVPEKREHFLLAPCRGDSVVF